MAPELRIRRVGQEAVSELGHHRRVKAPPDQPAPGREALEADALPTSVVPLAGVTAA